MEKLAALVNNDEWVIIDGVRYEPRHKVIEECARVAELFYDEHPAERVWGKPIAAAIRALKSNTGG